MNSIVMPKLGLTMTEGILASWSVAPGDEVRAGDVMFVVETDKIATEITARAAGRIDAIKVAEGETVPVGAVVATWTGPSDDQPDDDTSTEDVADTTGKEVDPAAARPTPQPAPTSASRIVSTPYARRLARSNGLDLHGVTGSGPGGRVKAADLQIPARRALSNVEKIVARRLTAAKRDIPHFYVMAEADVTALTELRTVLNNDERDIKISFNHLMLLATGRALQENAVFNVVWDNEEIVTLPGSDVGFAVDTPKGLFAPVLRKVGRKRLDELALEAK
jgi:pyruvate dehydrogenase E2 component (dihydrolipoamide acetyltransferase)